MSKIATQKCMGECGRELPLERDFYKTNSKMFTSGRVSICKNCLLKMIDYQNMESIYSVLQQLDIPYIHEYWVTAENSKSETFRAYIRMANSMHQFRDLTWADSQFEKSKETQNSQSIEKLDTEDERDIGKKVYSKKWMGEYSRFEIEYLDDYLEGLDRDFKILTENHRDYAKKIAKASLHMDKCFQDMMDGVTGADKRYKDAKDVFDTLSKSANFAESGRGQNDVGLGGFGKIVERVEQGTYIPKHTPLEPDEYDSLLDNIKHILKSV